MNKTKTLDLICLGRAAVDLYGNQVGSRLEDMSSFAKYLGGSSGNIAYGTARMGLKTAMLTRVGDEHMGRFVREELARAGVDTSHVVTDKERLTGMVVLGIKDRDTFPLIFYRNDCADMAVDSGDFDPAFIASSNALLITGTHFSTEQTYTTSKTAIEYAKAAGTKVILDIDYRPVLWGLTTLGDGETRFVSDEGVSRHLQTILPDLDLVVGTEEEVHIAGNSTDTLTALKRIRELTDATIVLKLGAQGCTVLDGVIPDSEEDFVVHTGVRVDVLNVLGAGDAFMSGFLRGWLRNEPHERSCAYANACGALVVSRHGCAPAIPSAEELDDYLSRAESIARPDLDTRLNYLHRVTTQRNPQQWDDLCIMAFDHRKQLFDMAREEGADVARIPYLKQLLVKATERGSEQLGNSRVGVLIDDTYGQDALNDVTGRGWWIARPVELPSSRPIELEGGRSIGSRLQQWPKEHIVKCLVFYHPEDQVTLRQVQERQVMELYRACAESGNELLLEIIPPRDLAADDDMFINAMQRFYNLGVQPDWWKLPPQTRDGWQRISTLLKARAPHCRGVVMLGLDAPLDELKEGLMDSAGVDVCKGFAVGRTIFGEPSRRWLRGDYDDEQLIEAVLANYMTLVDAWQKRQRAA
ncbi:MULTISPECIES: bifunctional 5-dehydro-2-deoxygluconokinase/5-dehydro-2-deoxyphosphogluconate aldolase [unclassified Halomonas]|uniref:bifunctional 5-dehydro-2-deoxygluconokinase/5-dehydro-2- deoxyphosphogluconate aldolase n=1 Tax=unclassified Halomonas TaxID=2609666 RepID=UPI001CF17A1F|nr:MULTISPECIES: 5-dehydro-2-deoxygluconokinase [unclassified Halomonas]MCA8862907.1 5-dehydro-2-deoxygluconokinase [Halomonas sp. SBBP1]UZH09587.1 5-dehydro-2-deoxygluconokinase [Halomonas sp. BDJS001]